MDRYQRGMFPQPVPQPVQLELRHRIGLVQHDHVGLTQLSAYRLADVTVPGLLAHLFSIDDDDDPVDGHAEGLRGLGDLARLGHSAGLDDDMVDPFGVLRTRDRAIERPSAMLQHMQPFCRLIVSPSWRAIRAASMFTSPKSFTGTAQRMPVGYVRSWFRSVALPAPR